MAAASTLDNEMPVVRNRGEFDFNSGNLIERLVFNHRKLVLFIGVLLTLVLGVFTLQLTVNASFEKMLPLSHPYIKNYLENKDNLRGLGNAVRIVIENPKGDIFDKEYLEELRQINDTLFLLNGVDRAYMKSLWTPAVRWTEVTEEGFQGGPVMPMDYDGSEQSMQALRINIARAGLLGSLVAKNYKSSMIFVPLLERDPETGARIDYGKFSEELEAKVRSKEAGGKAKVRVHIIGFAKLVGDLIHGLVQVMFYFIAAAGIAAAAIYFYTRCVRSTLIVLVCSLIAVTWQLGIVNLLGFELDPYSILVPFLVFAIGVSHGAQKMNGIHQDIGRGTDRYVAARYTFRRLFLAGVTALIADVVGFAVLMIIDIPVIRDLALAASIGVGVLVFTNLILVPVLLSFTGVSKKAAQRSVLEEGIESAGTGLGVVWTFLDNFTKRNWAIVAIVISTALAGGAFLVSRHLQVGDLDPGAPELRANSRYNRDTAYVNENYTLSNDQFAVIVKTPRQGCEAWTTVRDVDKLERELRALPSVIEVHSAIDEMKVISSGNQEGNPKWLPLVRHPAILGEAARQTATNSPELVTTECNVMPVTAYLTDHKSATLDEVVRVAEEFSAKHSDPESRQFLLAAGSAGMEAATNSVVRNANRTMLFMVYMAVILLCAITFRNWRAVVVAIVPLVITSILCEALMVALGMGIKVATLPVIALGVGIGVDYALYLLSVQLAAQRRGVPLETAYRQAVQFTGKVVALVGITLAAGVVTWAWSPIKFQADMGILLTFMFLWNMIGALILIPALSHFLLNDKYFGRLVNAKA